MAYQPRPQAASQPVRLAPRPVFLVGREGLLASLDAQLAPKQGHQEPRVVALCGLGGVGKTSMAVEYAHRHLAEVAVCWQFAAEDPTGLAAEFSVLAAQLGARDLVDARDPVACVHAVLARLDAEWLLVFDNVPDRASVERFIPPAGHGRVLITTQNQHWPPGQTLDVQILDPDVAAGLLVSRTGDTDQAGAQELAVELGGLPLALEQAAAYMQATGTTLAEYLPMFRDHQAELLARGEATGHPADVAATLRLAVARLTDEAQAAEGLLCLLAFLAPEPVPLTLLLAADQATGFSSPEAAALIGPLLGDPVATRDAIAALRHYSLIAPAGGGLVVVHRLVQALTRAQLSVDAADQWKQAAAALIDNAVPDGPHLPADWPVCAVLLPHAQAVLNLTSAGMCRIMKYLGWSENYSAARELCQLILNARSQDDSYGPEHPGTLAIRGDLGHWAWGAGDAAEARNQFAALLPIQQRVLGAEHPDTLETHSNLAYTTGEAGDPAGACERLATLVPICERVLGPEHPDTLTTKGCLAHWTGKAGDPARGRDQFEILVPIFERILGPEHPDTLTTHVNLASLIGEAGNAARARDQFAALLPIRARVLGPQHHRTLTVHDRVARWTGEAGDPAGARDRYTTLLPIFERILGAEHPRTLTIRANLARWTREAANPVQA